MKMKAEVLRSGAPIGDIHHSPSREGVLELAEKMGWEIEELRDGRVRAIAVVDVDVEILSEGSRREFSMGVAPAGRISREDQDLNAGIRRAGRTVLGYASHLGTLAGMAKALPMSRHKAASLAMASVVIGAVAGAVLAMNDKSNNPCSRDPQKPITE